MSALALAAPARLASTPAKPATTGEGSPALAAQGSAVAPTPEAVLPKRPADYLWAVLITRIYEVFLRAAPDRTGAWPAAVG